MATYRAQRVDPPGPFPGAVSFTTIPSEHSLTGSSGLANGHCFMDPVKGLGAILISQSFPFADPGILALRDEMEKAIYQSL